MCTARTPANLQSIPLNLGAEYERLTGQKCTLEGVKSGMKSDNWTCADMETIIVHVMTEETRTQYDLESLWALGEQFDSKLQFDGSELDFLSDIYKEQNEESENYPFTKEDDPWKYFDKNG